MEREIAAIESARKKRAKKRNAFFKNFKDFKILLSIAFAKEKKMNKGYFISFEGGEACGKSTQIKKLKEYISTLSQKDKFIFVREPGGTPLTEALRRFILNYEIDKPLPMTELLLFCAARVEDVEKCIKPALSQGKIVIADRFYDSTIAYQGMARKVMSSEDILDLTKKIIGDVKPDLTFYLQISPEEAFKRKSKMSEGLDRIEQEGIEFHKAVAKGYDYISSIEKERFYVLDANKSPEEIFDEIVTVLRTKIGSYLK